MEHLVFIELSEHDASRLKSFARQQVPSGGAWGGYWERVAQAIEAGIERLGQARLAERQNGGGKREKWGGQGP